MRKILNVKYTGMITFHISHMLICSDSIFAWIRDAFFAICFSVASSCHWRRALCNLFINKKHNQVITRMNFLERVCWWRKKPDWPLRPIAPESLVVQEAGGPGWVIATCGDVHEVGVLCTSFYEKVKVKMEQEEKFKATWTGIGSQIGYGVQPGTRVKK